MNLPTKFNAHHVNRSVYHCHQHEAPVNSVTYGGFEGSVILSSSNKGIRLFDATSGRTFNYPFSMHRNIVEVRSLCWSRSDSNKIALGCKNGTLHQFNLETKRLFQFRGHATSTASALAYRYSKYNNNSIIAVGCNDGRIGLWDASYINKPIIEPIKAHDRPISCLVYNPDGTKIVSGAFDHTIKLWHSHSLQPIYALEGHTNLVLAVDCSPDGTRIVSGAKDGTLRLWDLAYNRCIKTIQLPQGDYVRSLSYIQNGQYIYIAVGMHRGNIILFDNELSKIGSAIQVDISSILSISANPDGTKIVSGSFSGGVSTVNVSTFLCS
jgi:WD40 repeat protein